MRASPRIQSILLAIIVTVIWSFSWVLIKFGLRDDLPPLTFAGLRYVSATLFLTPVVLRSVQRRQIIRQLQPKDWRRLALLGLVYYSISQGLVFLSLVYLEAATYSLVLNFTAVIVLIGGIILLKEYPSALQIFGVAVFMAGVLLYFAPTQLPPRLGLIFGGASVLTNATSSLIGRAVNRDQRIPALVVTFVSMSIGSVLLLFAGLMLEPWAMPGLQSWGLILWLASVHTALTFTLWNHTLRVLPAAESSIINNTMLIQTAILGWVFLGEALNRREIISLLIALVGILLVQIRRSGKQPD